MGIKPVSSSKAVLLAVMMLTLTSLPIGFPMFSTQPPVDTTTYVAGTVGQPRRLDPARAYDTASGELILNVYQPLIFFGDKPLLPSTTTEITDRYVADLANFTSMIATKIPSVTDGHISADGKNWTFTIRSNVTFHDWTAANGSLIKGQILTTDDIVYTFKRMIVLDMTGGPSWMIALPAIGHRFLDDLDNNPATNTIEPVGVLGAGERLAASLIDSFMTSNTTTVTFHWASAWPETLLKQILSQSWSCIVNKAFCIEHGCWNGTFYDGWSTNYRRMPSDEYTPLDRYYAAKSKYPSSVGPNANSTGDVPAMCGTGPYRFTYWDKTNKVWRIDKFADYWGGWNGNHVTTVIEKGIDAWPVRRDQFLSGELDDCSVPRSNMQDLLEPFDPANHTPLPGITLYYNVPSLSNDAMVFLQNVDIASPYVPKNGTALAPYLFADVHMRRAFAHALNFTQYLEDAWSNEAIQPASWWLKGLKPDYENKTLTPHDINTTIVQDELMAAGVRAEGFETTLVYVLDHNMKTVCEMLASTFAGLGSKYKCNIVGLDWPTYLDYQENFYMPIFFVGWKASLGDPEDPARAYMHSNGDFGPLGKYNDTHADYLVDLGISQPDGPDRNVTYQELQYIYWRDVPSLPLVQAVGRRWQRDWNRGWYYNPLYPGLYFYDLYKIQVNKFMSGITLVLLPQIVREGGSTTVVARLLDEAGNPLVNQSIIFSSGTTSLGSANTNSSGDAVLHCTANVSAGVYAITASYAGNAEVYSTIATTSLTISLFATTTLAIDVPTAIQGQAATLKATLKDANGNPIQGLTVLFQIYDGASWSDVNATSTDTNGIASISYTSRDPGSFQIRAVFAGTPDYAPSTSTPANLSVNADYTPYFFGGAIIAVIILGALGYLVFRKRKKPATPE